MKATLLKLSIVSILLAILIIDLQAQCPVSTNDFATPYNSNNGQRGAMFDIVATNTVTITCFDANLYAGTTANYEIYYKAGSFIGSETNAAAWTFAGSVNALTSLGNNIPTPIPIVVNATIPAGETYGFYITNDFGGGISYTNGVDANTSLGVDANIEILAGVGKSYPFGLTLNFREINATAHYNLGGIILPVEWLSFDSKVNKEGFVDLNWTTVAELTNDYFTVERSKNGIDWQEIKQIQGAGTSNTIKKYYTQDTEPYLGISYYRLKQNDLDGIFSYSKIKAVEVTSQVRFEISIYPNPSQEIITLEGQREEINEIKIYDILGKQRTKEVVIIENRFEKKRIDISNLLNGIYFLKSKTQIHRFVKI